MRKRFTQYDGCGMCGYSKQKGYLRTTDRPIVEATSPIIKNLAQMEGQQANVYTPGPPPPPPMVPPEEMGNGPRVRPAAVAVTYEEGVPEYVPGGGDRSRAASDAVAAPANGEGGKRELNPLLSVLSRCIPGAGLCGVQYYERPRGRRVHRPTWSRPAPPMAGTR